MNESPFPLDRELDTARMIPVLKLEPLGLTLKRSSKLHIPHSALIPEPANYDVIIYTGNIEQNKNYSTDCVRWTEGKFLPRRLEKKFVEIDVQNLTYLSASLVSKIVEQPLFIVRAIPFVDGLRNADDDISLTVCFCRDNHSDYNMLLSDYQNRLSLEQYSTIYLRRHLKSENNDTDTGLLRVTVTSMNDTFVPDVEQARKTFPVSHLCTASRVSHQIKLKRNQDANGDVVEFMVDFYQAHCTPTKVFLKARIKDLMISQEYEDMLSNSIPKALKTYEDLKAKLSSMLERLHCRKLALYFELSPEEMERVENDASPGTILIKTLDEREMIMPQKMIYLIQGLKACHLHKIARTVSEYMDNNVEQVHCVLEETSGVSQQASTSKASSNPQQERALDTHGHESTLPNFEPSGYFVQTLVNEGYTQQLVLEALNISRNRLDKAREVLQCLEGKRNVSTAHCNSFLFKEQYVNENGGEIVLRETNTLMLIPVGALTRGSIVNITMLTKSHAVLPSEGGTIELTPIIKCGQEDLKLQKTVTLRLPHCAEEIEGITSVDLLFGLSNDHEIQWRKRKENEPRPVFTKDYVEVTLQRFCFISLNVSVNFEKPFSKRLRALPLIDNDVNPNNNFIITLWIYNDDETEHKYLLHEEITKGNKRQLDDYKLFTLYGCEKHKEIRIRSDDVRITPRNYKTELVSTTLWYNTRHKAEFQFQNRKGIPDVSFRLQINRQQFLRTIKDVTTDFKVNFLVLSQLPECSRSLIDVHEPQPVMEQSFQQLITTLSEQLTRDSCLKIAENFGLATDLRDKIMTSRDPGSVLFDTLVHKGLISTSNVSSLDAILTRTDFVHLAERVRDYRRRNVTFPTSIPELMI